ncbi:MAG: peptide deformylase [Bacteroidales bacterium]|nr:peptide deformylase [Bacteroidales bacterium]
MILPIVGYGHSVLRVKTKDIDETYPNLKQLIEDMFETMYKANGIGLAAPQINLPISVLVIDADPLKENYPEGEGFKKTMINPEILELYGEDESFEEGCLSLPGINENVVRKNKVRVRYFDEDFNEYEQELFGIQARIFQHEFDHLNGKVFTDRLSNIKRAFLKKKLNDIANNKVRPAYKMVK